MKKWRALWVLYLLGMVMAGCGPAYPEGPSMSFISPKDRIAGTWQWTIARRVEKGLETNLTQQVRGDTLKILDDGSFEETRYGLSGEWTLISRKKELNLVFLDSPDSIGISSAVAFEIRRLKNQEMWLNFADDSLQVEWQLISLD